jgi:hypothetical protein
MLEAKQMEDIAAWIGRLLQSHREKIWQAYLKTDGGISLSVVVKIFPTQKTGEVGVDGTLRFTESRVKEKFSLNFNAFMDPLFKDQKANVKKMRKGLAPGESVTITSGDKSVTLKGD